MSLENQSLLVIGGTSGMGKAIALGGLARGMKVTVAGREDDTFRAVQQELGDQLEVKAIDIGSEEEIKKFFSSAQAIDHVVTSAAFVRTGDFKSSSTEDARISFTGKFWSQYLVAKYAEVKQSILFFSGIYSRKPPKGTASVAAANSAVEGLARALAVDLAPIRVNAIAPGLIQGTGAYLSMSEEDRNQMYNSVAQSLPAGLVGDAESVAGVALAILESNYINGQVIDIDGGMMII